MKRYDLDTEIDGARMIEVGLGDFVRYEDHVAALSAAEERERVLREAMEFHDKLMARLWKEAGFFRSISDPETVTLLNQAEGIARAALATPAPEPVKEQQP